MASIPTHALSGYPTLRFFPEQVSFPKLNAYIALAFALLFAIAVKIDGTIYIDGRPVGFVEHPAIFVFLLSQAVLPFFVERGLRSFFQLAERSDTVLSPEVIKDDLPQACLNLRDSIALRTHLGRILYISFTIAGFAFFAWNSLQNQRPYTHVGTDFWDSVLHMWGYWSSRLYKFYVWLLVAPLLAHAQIMLVIAMKNLLLSAVRKRGLTLEPYHADGCGGVKVFIDSVLSPMVPVVISAALLTLSAFFVHRKYDVTTMGGLLVACTLFIFVYLVPAATLRKCIALEKERQLSEITETQNKFYAIVKDESSDSSKVSEALGILGDLSEVCRQITGLPNWPQLARVVRVVSVAASSPIIVGVTKALNGYMKSRGISVLD